MSAFFRLIISFFISIILTWHCFAEGDLDLRIDEKAFITAHAEDIKIASKIGINTFLFHIDSASSYDASLHEMKKKLNFLCESSHRNLKIIIDGKYQEQKIKSFIEKSVQREIHYYDPQKSIDSTSSVKAESILCFLSTSLVHLSDSIQTGQPYNGRFLSSPENRMILFESDMIPNDSLHQNCIHFWKSTGRVPNFILCDSTKFSEGLKTTEKLNHYRRFRGHVSFHGKTLNEIFWKQLPGTVTQGRFSFPITDYSLVLTPYKNGYRITPGEVIHHTHMKDIVRPFVAYNTDYRDQLQYHFKFENNINNTADPEHSTSILNQAGWVKDRQRGKVILFNTANSFVDYTKANNLNFNTPISVSAWLKPIKAPEFMGIIGIGTSFSFKLKNGMPDFTTAQIKDHFSDTILPLNSWTHVGFVFNPGGTVDFYINGQKEKSLKASDIQNSQQSLIIGNNIWGEQYFGFIDELMIWDRGLSDLEFSQLYADQSHPVNMSMAWFLLILPLLFLGSIFVKFRKKNILKSGLRKQVKLTPKEYCRTVTNRNKIEFFGRFNVETKENGNITTQFSPLLKQLLAFFVIKMVFHENKGVSTKELTDTFWPGFTKEQAKENRGTNIKKLRKLLQKVPGVQLIFRDKKWYIEVSDATEIDLFSYQQLVNQVKVSATQNSLSSLISLLNKGNILQETDISWLDPYKNRLTEDITNILLDVFQKENSPIIKLEAAKTMLLFDNLNEEALKMLILQLNESGNHGLAKQTFEEFAKRYEKLYSEKFPLDFNRFLKSEIS